MKASSLSKRLNTTFDSADARWMQPIGQEGKACPPRNVCLEEVDIELIRFAAERNGNVSVKKMLAQTCAVKNPGKREDEASLLDPMKQQDLIVVSLVAATLLSSFFQLRFFVHLSDSLNRDTCSRELGFVTVNEFRVGRKNSRPVGNLGLGFGQLVEAVLRIIKFNDSLVTRDKFCLHGRLRAASP